MASEGKGVSFRSRGGRGKTKVNLTQRGVQRIEEETFHINGKRQVRREKRTGRKQGERKRVGIGGGRNSIQFRLKR